MSDTSARRPSARRRRGGGGGRGAAYRRPFSPEQVEARAALVPELRYPEELPVAQRRQEILEAIRDHQVVVVAGETGSGKTTQLPKICLELGRGVAGVIGHTQPRRIAARSVAERISEELAVDLGDQVGYAVRFTDKVSDGTLVKLMTDGILLAEIQRDRMLSRYDTLIIDEAHERSLNIDFILGYLKALLPKRPDLKVVITSATIDPQRFSRHFDDAPVIEVSGRTYPVEVRYRPLVADSSDEDAADEPRDQVTAIVEAVEELAAEGPGDVLVFCSGEREIRDAAEALGRLDLGELHPLEVLPLYARLSAAEQHRVFAPHRGRRVVLATNVAETSLTVPGIRYVVDPGTARISRYSLRTKVQRLPIEAISQASARQRAGRCGRVAAGVCIRLYSEEDFEDRPEFTDPEILRTNLASVILQMTALGLGDVEAFPFVEPPDSRQVRDGVQLLTELGALADGGKRGVQTLTPVGRQLARLPIDPRLARMVLEADRNGCLREVLVIAAALSIQDPRERPQDKQEQAQQQHARFADKTSDFMAWLNLWHHVREQQKALSSSQFRRMCQREFLHYLRIREWQDLYSQLKQVTRQLGFTLSSSGSDGSVDPTAVHRSLLAGLLSHVGLREAQTREYLGARGAKFALWPGSALSRKPPAYVMAAELVETSRLWARVCAAVEPEWVEQAAPHLVSRTYSEPHWSSKQGAAMAYERVTLYGVPVVAGRLVTYGSVDPALSRELFIRHALVEGDWRTHHRFWHDNRRRVEEVQRLEERARRRGILVDDQVLVDFYDERVPADVVSQRHFDRWWKTASKETPDLLTVPRSLLVSETAEGVSDEDFPSHWRQGDLRLRLTYQFEPGTEADGVTVHVPVEVLNRLSPDGFDWQIPGLRHDLVTALIRSLPKPVRRHFVPAPNFAGAVLEKVSPADGPLLDVLERELQRMGGPAIDRDDWQLDRVPPHLMVTFRVHDGRRRTLGEGKDLEQLKLDLRSHMRSAVSEAVGAAGPTGEDDDSAVAALEKPSLSGFEVDQIPRSLSRKARGVEVQGFPALVPEGSGVALRVLESEAEQRRAMRRGIRALLLADLPSPIKAVVALMSNLDKLALGHAPGGVPALLDDALAATVDALVAEAGGPAWDRASYERLRDHVRSHLHDRLLDVLRQVAELLTTAHALGTRLRGSTSMALLPSLTDARAQLEGLVHPGFVSSAGVDRLPHLRRYLRALDHRLDKLPDNPARDRSLAWQVEQVADEYDDAVARLPERRRGDDDVLAVRWMLEELRVSLFAQQLGTPQPVSDKRIRKAVAALR